MPNTTLGAISKEFRRFVLYRIISICLQEEARQKYVDLVNDLKTKDSASAASVEPGSVRGLKFGKEGDFYRIQFDRPDKFNAITIEMYRGLKQAMNEANSDPSVKFTIFSGECFS